MDLNATELAPLAAIELADQTLPDWLPSEELSAPGRAAALRAFAIPLGWFFAALITGGIDALLKYLVLGLSPNPIAIGTAIWSGEVLIFSPLLAQWFFDYERGRPSLRAWENFSFLGVFTLFLAFYAATRGIGPTPYNEHVRQAWAMIHGHLWVVAPGYMEHVSFKGHDYLLHPPLPSIVLMPIVALWGPNVDQTAVSIVIGALEIALAWRLLGVMKLEAAARVWLTLFFGAGTILWYEATLGNSWGFVLVLSVAPTLLALIELFGKARPLRVGLFTGIAALARYDLALAFPLWMLMLRARGRSWRELLGSVPGFALAGVVYLWYSEMRFGSVSDKALWIWYNMDQYGWRLHPGGPFNLRNLPFNLYTALFMAPSFNDHFPYLHPSMLGQAMILTSPAFVLALRPSLLKPLPLLLWLTTAIGMAPGLTVYANGFVQFGTRYYIQVFPFLLALMALGLHRRADQLTRILVALSILMVAYGTWHVRFLGFG